MKIERPIIFANFFRDSIVVLLTLASISYHIYVRSHTMPPAPTEGSVATLRRDGSSGSSGIIHTPSDTDDEVDNGSSSASPSPSSDAESSSFHNTIETLANASRASLREHQIRPPRRSSDADGLSVANRSSIGSVLSVSAHASKMTSFFLKKILGSLFVNVAQQWYHVHIAYVLTLLSSPTPFFVHQPTNALVDGWVGGTPDCRQDGPGRLET